MEPIKIIGVALFVAALCLVALCYIVDVDDLD
jgi:hypothetical protein